LGAQDKTSAAGCGPNKRVKTGNKVKGKHGKEGRGKRDLIWKLNKIGKERKGIGCKRDKPYGHFRWARVSKMDWEVSHFVTKGERVERHPILKKGTMVERVTQYRDIISKGCCRQVIERATNGLGGKRSHEPGKIGGKRKEGGLKNTEEGGKKVQGKRGGGEKLEHCVPILRIVRCNSRDTISGR